MLSCPIKLSISQLPVNPMPRTILPNIAYFVEHATYSTSRAYLVKNIPPCLARVRSISFINNYPREIIRSCKGKHSDIFEEPNLNDRLQVDCCSQESVDNEDVKEVQRRIKIGCGNKGKVPWNLGLKHSEETRERIRLRTKEALKDPKVRKKMSEAPRALSNQTKAKIRSSLTRLWGTRLRWKRSREKFFELWAKSVATAAKKGGIDEPELEWDSYDKLKQEIALLQTEQTAERAKVKEMARVRAEKAAEEKAEKTARLAQLRREREEKAKARGLLIRKRNKKSKEEKEKLAEFEEEKLKERLMKIRKKKTTVDQVSSSQQLRPWEKFDLNSGKGLRQETSLADQIRFAKFRRSEQLLDQI